VKLSAHFDSDEFTCQCGCGYGNGYNDVSRELIDLLELMRSEADDRKMIIDSGCRCISHNEVIGGVEKSPHLRGEAADIRTFWSGERYRYIAAATKLGCNRIGVGKTFIHVDVCRESPQGVVWLYS
jgi:zinc D-Ala-D-Ala carboxypeptidase